MNRMTFVSSLDFLDQPEQPFLELAAIGRAGDQGGHRQLDQAAIFQLVGYLTGRDERRQALDDGGLADAGEADQHRVVLLLARQRADELAQLRVAADERVKLALAGQRRQVAADTIQDRCARRPARFQSNHVHAQVAEDAQRDALGFILQDGGQQVAFFDLGGAFRLRQLLGPLQVLRGAGGQLRLGAGSGLALAERGAQPVADAFGVVALAAEGGRGGAVQLRQRDEKMGRTQNG